MLVRARSGVSRTMLKDRFASLSPGVTASSSQDPSNGRGWTLRPLTENWISSQTRQSLWVLAAATALLLLTAAANLSSLTMAQIFGRTRQMAIQSALGASRARLVRQALAEQVFIGIAGLALAAPLTVLAMRAARVLMPDTLTVWTMHVVGLDLRAALVMVLVAIGTPVLAAVVPAWLASRTSVLALLQQDSRSSMGSRPSGLLRQVMVVTEVTCAVVLLVTGALLVRSFVALTSVDRGFDSTKLLSVSIQFPARAFPSSLSRRLFVDRAAGQLRQTPAVLAVALASGVPPEWGQTSFGQIAIDGQPPTTRVRVAGEYVQPDFFRTTGIPVLAGRAFDETDDATHVIVSHSLAAAFWPGTSAVGHRFRLFEGRWFEIVGVAGDVKTRGLDDERSFAEYFPDIRPPVSALSAEAAPTDNAFSGGARLVIRSNDVERLSPVIRATIASVDRRALIDEIAPVEALYAKTIAQPRMLMWLMASFSAVGLLVAGIGVYGVLSTLVAQQLREIGVRLMLGAEPAAMSRMVFRGGMALAGIGSVVGVVVALLCGRVVSSVLFSTSGPPTSPATVVSPVLGRHRRRDDRRRVDAPGAPCRQGGSGGWLLRDN